MAIVTDDGTNEEFQKQENIGFRAGRARKKGARLLAVELDFDDVSELMKWLLDREIAEHYPHIMKQIEAEDPKARSRRQARKKAG